MNAREKKLLIAFLAILLAVVHFYGYQVYSQKLKALEAQVGTPPSNFNLTGTGLLGRIEMAQQNLDQREQKLKEMQWLSENTPEPKSGLTVQSELAVYAQTQAESRGLEVIRPTPTLLPNDQSGAYYHRAIVKIMVTGMEADLYPWLIQLHSPKDFRAVTHLRMNPNKEDDTKIDAQVQVEQWYVPSEG